MTYRRSLSYQDYLILDRTTIFRSRFNRIFFNIDDNF